MNRRLGAILAHQIDGDMNVIVAVLRDTMPDRNPSARGLRAIRVVELHRAHEVARDLAPLLIGQHALVGAQRQ